MRSPLLIAFVMFLFLASPALAGCRDGDRRVCGTDTGVCEFGRSVCRNGVWGECEGGVGPLADEICGDGLDNDCDGKTDEGCVPWTSFVLIGTGTLFIGIGLYYMQKGKGERIITKGLGKD